MDKEFNNDVELYSKCKSPYRWLILFLGCTMMVGSYYCFDIPAALKTQIDDYMGNPDDYEVKFSLLYTLYAAPNVILPFFGGYLVDRFGIRFCLLLFCSLIAVGQVIFSLGMSVKSWPIIFMGRLVFGFGGESFTVANSALLADWFKGKELAFAFGVNLSISKLGSVINNLLSPVLAERFGVIFALWFGAMLCGASLCCVLLTMPIDKAMDDKIALQLKSIAMARVLDGTTDSVDKINNPLQKIPEESVSGKSAALENEDNNEEATTFRDVFTLPYIFWILVISCVAIYGCVLPFNNISSSLLLERDYFIEPSSSCHLADANQCQSDTNIPINCPSSRWYQPPLPNNCTIDGTVYNPLSTSDIDCTDDSWKNGCLKEYCDRLTKAQSTSSVIMSIPYIISAVFSPPLGFAIDIYGMRAVIAAIAPAILIIVHLFLALTKVNPIGPLIGQGLAYTGFVSVLWPAIPLVVEERVAGLAFGIVTSMQNLACALIPLVVASIYTEAGDKYIPNVEYLFVSLAVIGVIVGIYLNIYDINNGGILNSGAAPVSESDGLEARPSALEKSLLRSSHDYQKVRLSEELDTDENTHTWRNRSTPQGSFDDRKIRGHHGGSFSAHDEAFRGGAYRTKSDSKHL